MPKPPRGKRIVTVWIEEDLYEALYEMKWTNRRSLSEEVRIALENHVTTPADA